jgi:hypothetical protein
MPGSGVTLTRNLPCHGGTSNIKRSISTAFDALKLSGNLTMNKRHLITRERVLSERYQVRCRFRSTQQLRCRQLVVPRGTRPIRLWSNLQRHAYSR